MPVPRGAAAGGGGRHPRQAIALAAYAAGRRRRFRNKLCDMRLRPRRRAGDPVTGRDRWDPNRQAADPARRLRGRPSPRLRAFKSGTVSNLPASSPTLINRRAVRSLHPNSRSSHGSQLPCPAISLASISRRPISTMSCTARLPRRGSPRRARLPHLVEQLNGRRVVGGVAAEAGNRAGGMGHGQDRKDRLLHSITAIINPTAGKESRPCWTTMQSAGWCSSRSGA